MIIGLFLRNIKSYEKTSFIPIVKNKKPYSFFIGENGVGKSSILEALDVYFNRNREWNINKNNKNKDEVFIAPLHLIRKDSIKLKDKEIEYIQIISNILLTWNINNTSHIMSHEFVKEFYSFLSELKELNNLKEYFLMITPLHYDDSVEKKFFAFDSLIRSEIKDYNKQILLDLLEKIKNLYAYIYIPVETPVDEILRMETPEMQLLVSEDILKYTENMLTDKNIQEGNKKLNIVDKINNKLDEFMVDVNYTISKIDNSYSYSADGRGKKNLTAKDIREQIFKAYFSIRSLNKNTKTIVQLSSGEKRKALIDIATAFLEQESERSKEVILAIDEPETSMHMKKVFNQFKQLESLAINNKVQFIGTTHWYGFLPITDYGNLNHISKNDESLNLKNFDFFNLFERNDNFPDDIEMKSFFELVTSILTSIKAGEYNKWIICEGSDDKKYLDYYLKYKYQNRNLIILPVSGCGNVKKLYTLLYASLCEKDKVKVSGKILCLVDTDLGTMGLSNNFASDSNNIIFIRRLQQHDNEIKLDKIAANSQRHYQTEVEDSLEPEKYYCALQHVVDDTEYKSILTSYILNTKCKTSKLNSHHGESLLKFDEEKGDIKHVNKFKDFIKFIEETKVKQKICNYYISSNDSINIPSWIKDIVSILELDEIEIRNETENIKKEIAEFENEKESLSTDSLSFKPSNVKKDNKLYYVIADNNKDNEHYCGTEDIQEIEEKDHIDCYENLDEELFNLLDNIESIGAIESLKLETLIVDNKKNKDLILYLSNNFINLTKNNRIITTILHEEIPISFSIQQLISNLMMFIENHSIHKMIQIIFINAENIKEYDLESIINLLNSKDLVNNRAIINECYFLIYASLKINNIEYIKTIFSKQELLNLICSIFTIIYYGHYNKYIQIGYKLKNIVALSNSILNTKSFGAYIDVYIHALKEYNVFDKLLKEDKQKTFIRKLTSYYKNKPIQNSEYNHIFNMIFNDFNIS